ncbi:hypothetical protein CPB86DRAFT_780540 [Serendipita vermifera]|nr:hypothetical protein CPB86DRAFT_780540 [Serendipita vermifera]
MNYEIVLAGTFPSDDEQLLKDVQNRLSLHTDSSVVLHREDYEFRLESNVHTTQFGIAQAISTTDGVPLRAKRDLTISPGSPAEWTVHTYLKPIRQFTKAVIRPCAAIPLVTGNALTFASALGYELDKMTTRKGYLFTRGTINICLFQYVAPSKAPSSPWHVEVVHSVLLNTPKNNQTPITNILETNVENMLTISALMKGLVDLVPPEH